MTGIIYLQKEKFEIYAMPPGRVSEFLFVPEVIKELDIIDQDLLDNLVKLFVTNSKIPACNLVIVIAENASFVKDIHPQSPDSQTAPADLAKEFADSVPYEKVANRNFPLQQGVRAFAVNEELYTGIMASFEKMGFKTEGVYPGFVFGNIIGKNFVLTPDNSELIISTANAQSQYNLLTTQENNLPEEKVFNDGEGAEEEVQDTDVAIEEDEKPKGKTDKKRLFMMLGVFLVLVFILIFVMMNPPA